MPIGKKIKNRLSKLFPSSSSKEKKSGEAAAATDVPPPTGSSEAQPAPTDSTPVVMSSAIIKFTKNPNFTKPSGRAAYARAIRRYGHRFGGLDATGHNIFKFAENKVLAKDTSGNFNEVPAQDIQNGEYLEPYVVPVTIGTPGATLNLDFDTGSSDLWVWSSEVKVSTSGHTIYNPSKSSTSKIAKGQTWSISYGDGSSASGNVYTDVVKIGDLSIPNQSVELAQKLSASFQQPGSDGLLGLAWPQINTVKPKPVATPVENLINQKIVKEGLFTVKLDNGDSNGFYSFGAIDTNVAISGTIAYAPVDNSQGFWQVPSESYSINGQTFQRSGNTTIADTGTTLALVADDVVSAIYENVKGAALDNQQGGWTYDSDADIPDVAFAIGDTLYTISKKNFAFGDAGNGKTFGGIQSRGNMDFDIFGDVFLKNVYVVFDQSNTRLGVAQRTD